MGSVLKVAVRKSVMMKPANGGNVDEPELGSGLSCFSDDSVDVGNLISASSVFSKSSLNIWKFTVVEQYILSWTVEAWLGEF